LVEKSLRAWCDLRTLVQADVSYWVIRGLWLVGLAGKVKVPSKKARAEKRRGRVLASLGK
jgi:hypothetical protein